MARPEGVTVQSSADLVKDADINLSHARAAYSQNNSANQVNPLRGHTEGGKKGRKGGKVKLKMMNNV